MIELNLNLFTNKAQVTVQIFSCNKEANYMGDIPKRLSSPNISKILGPQFEIIEKNVKRKNTG